MEPDCSESAKDLISRLITLDVAVCQSSAYLTLPSYKCDNQSSVFLLPLRMVQKRWTATEALEHTWLTGLTATDLPLVCYFN
jgi:hypothetical protein